MAEITIQLKKLKKHQALAIRNRSYTNQVRLRGLTKNLELETCVVRYAQRKRDRQVLFVWFRDFQSLGARCELLKKVARQ